MASGWPFREKKENWDAGKKGENGVVAFKTVREHQRSRNKHKKTRKKQQLMRKRERKWKDTID